MELAFASGISQRHLSFLESGRSNAGRETVIGLSVALDLPLRERNRLLGAAGFAPMYLARSLDLPEMASIRAALERTLAHHEPYPAVVIDHQWNLMIENKASQALLSLIEDPEVLYRRTCGDGPRNVMRAIFHEDGIWRYMKNWEEQGANLLNRLRREALVKPGTGLEQLIADIVSSPHVPASWHLPDWHLPMTPVHLFQVEKGGLCLSLFSMLSVFGTPQDVTVDEIRVETFFPHDETTDMVLRGLAMGP